MDNVAGFRLIHFFFFLSICLKLQPSSAVTQSNIWWPSVFFSFSIAITNLSAYSIRFCMSCTASATPLSLLSSVPLSGMFCRYLIFFTRSSVSFLQLIVCRSLTVQVAVAALAQPAVHHYGQYPLTGLDNIFKMDLNSQGVLHSYACTSAARITNSSSVYM